MIRKTAAALPGFQEINGRRVFVLRDGVRFGMTPQEVIRAERANGMEYDGGTPYFTDDGLLFDAGIHYQLNYTVKTGFPGGLPVKRFEYDFDRKRKRLYQFYYVLTKSDYTGCDNRDVYWKLSLALQAKYGPATANSGLRSRRLSQDWPDHTRSNTQWILRDGDRRIIADLWLSIYDIVTLAFQEEKG